MFNTSLQKYNTAAAKVMYIHVYNIKREILSIYNYYKKSIFLYQGQVIYQMVNNY